MSRAEMATVQVWDPLVRISHWTLVAAFFVAYFTEDDLLTAHVWAGYLVGIVVVLRVAWGFVGPQRARFSDFVRGPAAVFGYLRDLVLFRAVRYLGHSPAGGAMVVALLANLAITVATGLAVYGAKEHAGPVQGWFAADSGATSLVATAFAKEGDERREGRRNGAGRSLEAVHEFFANLTLVLVIIHVAGVLLASVVHRENLARAMLTGRKRGD